MFTAVAFDEFRDDLVSRRSCRTAAEQLGKLHEQGILTDEEFSQQKEKVLAG